MGADEGSFASTAIIVTCFQSCVGCNEIQDWVKITRAAHCVEGDGDEFPLSSRESKGIGITGDINGSG